MCVGAVGVGTAEKGAGRAPAQPSSGSKRAPAGQQRSCWASASGLGLLGAWSSPLRAVRLELEADTASGEQLASSQRARRRLAGAQKQEGQKLGQNERRALRPAIASDVVASRRARRRGQREGGRDAGGEAESGGKRHCRRQRARAVTADEGEQQHYPPSQRRARLEAEAEAFTQLGRRAPSPANPHGRFS